MRLNRLNSTGGKLASSSMNFAKSRIQRLEQDFRRRKVPERHLFVIVDGQNLFSNENLKLIKVEINQRLCRIIPQKTWDSKAAQRMSFFEVVQLAAPSKLLQEQVLMEVIDEVNQRLDGFPGT